LKALVVLLMLPVLQRLAWVTKNVEFLSVCLSVCLFVTLLNVRDRAPDFAMKALEYRKDFE